MSLNNTTNLEEVVDIFERYEYRERIWLKVSLILTGFVSEILSIGLCTSLILYEKYGGDPQKRTILNMLLSSLCHLVLSLTLPLNVFLFRICYGPLPELLAKIIFFMPKAYVGFAALFCLNEMIVIRYISVFIWKRVPPINETLFSLALNLSNLLVALVLTLYANMGHNIEQGLNLLVCGIFDKNEDKTPVFRLYFYLLILTVVMYVTAGSRLALKRMKQEKNWKNKIQPILVGLQPMTSNERQDSENLTPQIQEQEQEENDENEDEQGQGLQYNNQAANSDMFSLVVNILTVVANIVLFMQVFAYTDFHNPVAIAMGWLIPHICITVIIPWILCLLNPAVFKYIKREYFEHE